MFYKIHGAFRGPPDVSRQRHRCAGVPKGCDVQLYARDAQPDALDMGLEDNWIWNEFRRTNAALAPKVAASDQCLILRGVVPDPPSLDYFRDAVGLVTALMESGGLAVFDPHMFKWWSADEWRQRAFEPASAAPRHHVVTLVSDEADGRSRWYHTRGMRKFGRPDISVHNVVPSLEKVVKDLCDRLIEMQAFGAVIPENKEIEMSGVPTGWRCRHAGDLEDPDFNNRHIAVSPVGCT